MSAVIQFRLPPGKPVLRGQDHFWLTIRELDGAGPWSVADVYGRSNVRDRATVGDYVRRLVAGGVAEEAGLAVQSANGRKGRLYRLLSRPLRTPRFNRDGSPVEQGRGQTNMWNVMRGPGARSGFTFHDLKLYGSTASIPITLETAKSYVRRLAEAGYLVALKPGRPGTATMWRLKPAMDTGPKPPLILRARIVFDQNRMEAVGGVEAEEVSP